MNRREVFIIKKRLSDLILPNYWDEEWKDIKGWEGIYQVSNTGKVKSLDRVIKNQYNINTKKFDLQRTVYGKILKPTVNPNGYYQVTLSRPGHKRKQVSIHRLVAEAFIPNPDNLPMINHKDENKLNNRVDNLEWCTQAENIKHSCLLHPGRISKNNTNNIKRSYPVLCVETGIIYPSSAEAARQTGLSQGNIANVCRGAKVKDGKGYYYTVHSAGGYHWEYVKESEVKTSL